MQPAAASLSLSAFCSMQWFFLGTQKKSSLSSSFSPGHGAIFLLFTLAIVFRLRRRQLCHICIFLCLAAHSLTFSLSISLFRLYFVGLLLLLFSLFFFWSVLHLFKLHRKRELQFKFKFAVCICRSVEEACALPSSAESAANRRPLFLGKWRKSFKS